MWARVAEFATWLLDLAISRGAYDHLQPTEEELWAETKRHQEWETRLYREGEADGFERARRTYVR